MAGRADLRLAAAAVGCWLAAALAVGGSSATVLRLAAVGAVLAVLVWCVPWRRPVGGSVYATVGFVLVAVVVVLAACAAQLHVRESGPLDRLVTERAVVEVVGTVRAEPVPVVDRWSGDGTAKSSRPAPADDLSGSARALAAPVDDHAAPIRHRTVLAVEELTGRGRTSPVAAGLVAIGPGWDAVPYGARVTVSGRLGPVDPGDEARGMLITWGPPRVVGPQGPVDRAVHVFRQALLRVTASLAPDARGLVPGSAIGDTSRIPADLDQAMRAVGLTHITAVSGGHFAVLWVGVLSLCGLLRLPRPVRAVVLVTTMAGFVLLVHPEPSVLRAAAMGGVAVVGLILGRSSAAVPALAASILVLLVLDPWLARSYGFVLSVLATGAIVLLGPTLVDVLGRVVPHTVATLLAVPLAAQAVCAPVLVLLDPAVSAYAVVANVLAAPAMVPATVLGVLATLTAPWAAGPASLLAHGASAATWWIAQVARGFAGLPGALVPWAPGPLGAALLAAATAAALVLVLGRWRRVRVLAVAVLVLALVPGAKVGLVDVLPGAGPPSGWRVVMCDVGQGDGLVVRSGPGSAVVIDVGPDGSAMDACLDRLAVREVDLLVLTHFHADHVGGLDAVLAHRTVRGALVSRVHEPAGEARRTLDALERAGVPVTSGAAGLSGSAGQGPDGVRWAVLQAGAEGANDSSLVTLLESPDLSVLALGDLEPPGQVALAATLPAGGVEVDVLKVAHHGSAHQSPRLAARVRATVALIGVGVDNDYGHPAPATVGRLRDSGAFVLTTADCGDIAVGPVAGRPHVSGGALTVSAACVG